MCSWSDNSGTGKTLLFRALAGLWPWGSGTRDAPGRGIDAVHAANANIFRRARCARCSLILRPRTISPSEACLHALERLGLERLGPMLDAPGRWDLHLDRGRAAQPRLRERAACTRLAGSSSTRRSRRSRMSSGRRSWSCSRKTWRTPGFFTSAAPWRRIALFTRTLHLEDDAEGLKLGAKNRPRAPRLPQPRQSRLKPTEQPQIGARRHVCRTQRAPSLPAIALLLCDFSAARANPRGLRHSSGGRDASAPRRNRSGPTFAVKVLRVTYTRVVDVAHRRARGDGA